MSQFRTPVELSPFPWQSGYEHKNMFIGSCFTENIGEIMQSLALPTDLNPFGILFNPVSIARAIKRLVAAESFAEDDLFHFNGLWHSYGHHGRFSGENREHVLLSINDRLQFSSRFLQETDFLFITLGTAWVYELKSTGEVVANCHKVPAGEFRRFRLTLFETIEVLKDCLESLWSTVPGLKVIFTVSPVRHIKDGAVENQLSKSTLLLAVDALVKGFGKERCTYFPSYELVMDELRDYRFYAADMVHLSEVAVRFIWEKFAQVAISQSDREVMKRVDGINRAIAHKPFNRLTSGHLQFIEHTLTKVLALSDEYPYISLDSQIRFLESEIQEIKKSAGINRIGRDIFYD